MKLTASSVVATASQVLMALGAMAAVVILAVYHIIDGQACVGLIAGITGISGGGVVAQHATNVATEETAQPATRPANGHAG